MGYTHTWGGARKSAACATLASGHCQRASAGSIALERAWVESADGRDAPRLDMPRSSLRVATLSELLHLQRPAERADDALRSDSDSDGMDGMRTVPLLNRRTDDGGRIPQDPVRAVNSASRAAPTEVRPSDGSPSLAMLRRWQSYTSDSSSSEEEDGGKQHKASARVPASRARPPAAVTHPGGGATHPLPAAQHPVAGRQASKRQAKPAAHGKGDASLLASLDRALLEFLTATAADEVPVPVSGGKTWRDEAMPELPDTFGQEQGPHIIGSSGTSRTAALVSTLGEMYDTMAKAGTFRNEHVVDLAALPAQLQSVRVAQQFAAWAEQQKLKDVHRDGRPH